MDPCFLTNLRNMLPLLKASHIQMKVSIDLLFIYMHIFTLVLFVLHEECVS